MVYTFEHEQYGTIMYDESIWSGKKTIKINGNPCHKVNKTVYQINFNDELITVKIVGNNMKGVSLVINGVTFKVTEKTTWYEYILTFLPFTFIMIFGNIPTLFEIFPVVAGAIGGLISALFGILGLTLMRSQKNIIIKIVIGLVAFAATLFVCNAIAVGILEALS